MANIKDIDEVTVVKKGTSVYEISTIYKGYYRHRLYVGYSRRKAVSQFKKALERGEV